MVGRGLQVAAPLLLTGLALFFGGGPGDGSVFWLGTGALVAIAGLVVMVGVPRGWPAILPLAGRPPEATFVATIALAAIIEQGLTVTLGAAPRTAPAFAGSGAIEVAGLTFGRQPLAIVAVGGVLVAAVWHLLEHTQIGRRMRAVAADRYMARAVGMSRSVFAADFRQKVGAPPLDYLLRWRMQVARDALRRGETVAAVAARIGYASESAFGNAFKRVHGRAPKRYWTTEETSLGSASSAISPTETPARSRARR